MEDAILDVYDITYRNAYGVSVAKVISRNSLTGAESLLIEKLNSKEMPDGEKASKGLEILYLETPKTKKEDLKKYKQEGVIFLNCK